MFPLLSVLNIHPATMYPKTGASPTTMNPLSEVCSKEFASTKPALPYVFCHITSPLESILTSQASDPSEQHPVVPTAKYPPSLVCSTMRNQSASGPPIVTLHLTWPL